MKSILSLLVVSMISIGAMAKDKTFSFRFKNKPMSEVLETYTKETGQTFIFKANIDANKGSNISILNEGKVSPEKAFELLSQSLAAHGLAISTQNDTMVIQSVRNIQRSYIPVVTHLPPIAPEKVVTWVINLKHAKAPEVLKNLRILPSKDGEITAMGDHQLVITDWVTNLHRVKMILDKVDHPAKKTM